MSMHTCVVLLILVGKSLSQSQQIYSCTSDPCIIAPKSNSIAICTNKFKDCTIDCSKPNQCEFNNGELIVFSGSERTTILCNNIDSCMKSKMYIGLPPKNYIPKGYSINDFTGNDRTLVFWFLFLHL